MYKKEILRLISRTTDNIIELECYITDFSIKFGTELTLSNIYGKTPREVTYNFGDLKNIDKKEHEFKCEERKLDISIKSFVSCRVMYTDEFKHQDLIEISDYDIEFSYEDNIHHKNYLLGLNDKHNKSSHLFHIFEDLIPENEDKIKIDFYKKI